MSPEPLPQSPSSWPVLDLTERRVLGVLVEKAKTTPDAYPMSVNGLVTGSNQKSNRDPVLNLSEMDIEDALTRCQKKGLTTRLTGGGRVERWKHNLYEAWTQDKVELAILAELLLRGPQTEGELRGRASRMEPIEDLDKLRSILKPLVQRNLIVYLTAEDRRGATLTHGFHDPQELGNLKRRAATEPAPPTAAPTLAAPAVAVSRIEERMSQAERVLAEVRQQVAEVQELLRTMQEQIRGSSKMP